MMRRQNEAEAEAIVTDTSVGTLIDSGLLALSREMKNLLVASAHGKLDPASARDLRDTVKLLFELKDREDAAVKAMPQEKLNELAKKALDEQSDQ